MWEELEPHVVIYYLFSGPEKDTMGSFTAACRTLNASVRAYDTLINPQGHDLVQPHVWEQIKFLLKDEADGLSSRRSAAVIRSSELR